MLEKAIWIGNGQPSIIGQMELIRKSIVATDARADTRDEAARATATKRDRRISLMIAALGVIIPLMGQILHWVRVDILHKADAVEIVRPLDDANIRSK